MSDHLTFRGYVNPSESDVSISRNVDILAILTTFEATSQLLFTLNGVPAPSSPMETDDASLRLDKDEADNSWIFGPLMSYCMLMDHLATSSFILSSSTKQLLDQPLVSGNVSFPPDGESFVKVLQSKKWVSGQGEEALRQAGTNSVEIATDWLFTHPEEPQEDAELARALAMSLGSTDSTSKDVEVADANDLKHEEEEVNLPVVDDLLANSMRLLQVKE
ncbi:hypothetical protein HPP92_024549 [Vanilla planifolia]|uniref:Uncharacterized protein n=1 Tax=Vanilla planifolia TaxID=51239 RepID=A0A835UB93_VANPL|nr:hypothetical protein HPP92_024549 [Vanilla planifolia]